MTDVLDPGARRPRRRGRPARRAGRRPRRRRLAHADARRPGWDVATQVAHLAWTDEVASRRRPTRTRGTPSSSRRSPTRRATSTRRPSRSPGEPDLLERWRTRPRRPARPRSPRCPAGEKMPWFGPPMSATSMATARLMETWAHSLDVHEALGAPVEDTDRIRHVAHLGVRTRNFAFAVHGLDAPAEEFRIDLVAPSRRRLELGTRGRRADADRERRRLLPAGHPARPPRRHRPRRHRRRRRPLARHRPGLRRPAGRGTGAASDAATEPHRGSATAPASTATGSARCARCSRAGELDVLTGDYLAELTMLILGRDQLKDPAPRLRPHLRPPGRGLPRPRPGARRADRRQRRRPQPRRPRRPAPRGRPRARPRPAGRPRRGRRRAPPARPRGRRAHRQRLPRRLRHRRRAARRRRRRRHRPGHRRLARRRPGGRAPRLDARRRTTSWRARSSPATSSSAAPRRPAATSAASSTCPHRDRPLGFPVAEVAADGSSVITKHAGTGGAVTVDTVTAQLVYEIQSTRYLGPDVTVHLDSVRLEQAGRGPGRDHAASLGEAPPERLKVCVNELGGWRNSRRARADRPRRRGEGRVGARPARTRASTAAEVAWSDVRASRPPTPTPRRPPPPCCAAPSRTPRPTRSAAPSPPRPSSSRSASYPGFTMTAPPAPGHAVRRLPRGVRRPRRTSPTPSSTPTAAARSSPTRRRTPRAAEAPGARPSPYPGRTDALTRRLPLGTFVHARSGDKGGDANVGLWVAHDGADQETYDARVQWLFKLMSPRGIRDAAARGGRPRRRRVAAAPPRRGQPRRPRPARRRRRRVHALRPAGQGARRVAALAAGLDRGEPRCDRRSARRCGRPPPSSSAARSRRTCRSGRTPARSRARCTARPASSA